MKRDTSVCKFVPFTNKETIFTTNFVYETKPSVVAEMASRKNNTMCLVTEGNGILHTEMPAKRLEPGVLFFTFDGVPYRIENTGNLQYMYITFSGKRSQVLFSRFGISPAYCVFEGNEGLLSFWQNCLNKANEKNLDLISESVLMYTFSQMTSSEEHKDQFLIGEILKLIEDNFNDSEFTLTTASNELGYNAKYISRLFKKGTGLTFSEHLKNVRVQNAIFLMEQGITSVKNVAWLSGYRDPLYFSNVFKKTTGMSPSEFINK